MNKCYLPLKNGISIIKENVIATIASCAENSKEKFTPFVEKIIPLLINELRGNNQKIYA